MVLLPAAAAVLLMSRLLLVLYHIDTPEHLLQGWIVVDPNQPNPWGEWVELLERIVGGVVAGLWFVASLIAFCGAGRVRLREEERSSGETSARMGTGWVLWGVVLPMVVSAVLFCRLSMTRQHIEQMQPVSAASSGGVAEAQARAKMSFEDEVRARLAKNARWLVEFAVFLLVPTVVVSFAYSIAAFLYRGQHFWPRLQWIVLACLTAGVLLFLVHRFLLLLSDPNPADLIEYVHARAAARVTTFGPPLVLAAMVLSIFLGTGLQRSLIGEELREWWASLCARLLMVAIVWTAVNLIALYATPLVLQAGPWVQAALASGWLLTVGKGVMLGFTGQTDALKPSNTAAEWAARLTPPLFLAGLLVGISLLLHAVADSRPAWERVAHRVGALQRGEPEHPPTKTISTVVDARKRTSKDSADPERVAEEKGVVERTYTYDETRAASYQYWLGMLHISLPGEKQFEPRAFYRLAADDFKHLRAVHVDEAIVARLENLEGEKFAHRLDFLAAVKSALRKDEVEGEKTFEEREKNLADQLGGQSSWVEPGYDRQLVELARDANLINFRPGLLTKKFGALWFGCVVLVAFAAWRVDVNLNSLHAVYGNRLIRAYLGASRLLANPAGGSAAPNPDGRAPDPLTGLDPKDDLDLKELLLGSPGPGKPSAYDGPYLLINAALNLVHGDDLAWQERKATSFVFSPLYCGSESTGYRGTGHYAGGVRLGTAMTISGAAVSPNSGYNSSASVTALLTVFNARLGAWLGNPRQDLWRENGPRMGFVHLFKEMFGLTDAASRFVYLSDGGHFENLGVYELIRRRCRYIIVSDAGADPGHVFQDLGNLVRKVRIDFGIDIEIDHGSLDRSVATGLCRWHCVVGRIRYDQVEAGVLPGTLVYLKPSLSGDEPADVLQYKTASPTFPHETTVDQFFSESQVESYRTLGLHVGRSAFGEAVEELEQRRADGLFAPPPDDGPHYCRDLFSAVSRRWFALPPAYETRFLQSAEQYMEVQKALASEPGGRRLSREMYSEIGTDPTRGNLAEDAALLVSVCVGREGGDPPLVVEAGPPAGDDLHAVLRMLQVMENAWLGLDLEVNYAHPLNRGWMGVFYRWTSSAAFRRLWPVVRSEFARRFVSFLERQMRFGRVRVELQEFTDAEAIPESIRREMREWEGEQTDGLRTRLAGHHYGWLIYPKMHDQPRPAEACGIVLTHAIPDKDPMKVAEEWLAGKLTETDGKNPLAKQSGELEELLVWVHGPYRNSGIGREAVVQALAELKTKYSKGTTYRLGVRFPRHKVTGPGGRLLEQMWLTFYHYVDFRRAYPALSGYTSAATTNGGDADTILLRDFVGTGSP